MSIPAELTNRHVYTPVWSGRIRIPIQGVGNSQRTYTEKTFHAFIENTEQSAHDPAMRAFCQALHVGVRPNHRGQVNPRNDSNPATNYYRSHGEVASEVTRDVMVRRWRANTTFQTNVAYPLAVQAARQPNGYHYEITMWYDVRDIYVTFHCYPD